MPLPNAEPEESPWSPERRTPAWRARPATGFSQYLALSILAVMGGFPLGLLIGGGLVSLAAGLTGLFDTQGHLPAGESFALGLMITLAAMLYGLFPAFVYGAPMYAVLSRWQRANVLSVLVVGALPGVLLIGLDRDLAAMTVLYGSSVAVATHALARRRMARLHAPDSLADTGMQ